MKDSLVPPRTIRDHGSHYEFPSEISLSTIHRSGRLPLRQLRSDLSRLGVKARLRSGASRAEVNLLRDRVISHPQGYRLRIAPDSIVIVASTAAGAYYGVQSLRELVRGSDGKLPCCEIEDEPTFNRRAVYCDCSRGKVPKVQTVKALIEFLAHWKVNELQLYIENVFRFSRHPEIGRGFSPYSPDDILSMQEHARLHHIRFVPSLTSFGHFEKILMLPRYWHLGELPGYNGHRGGTTLCPTDPGSIKLLEEMYDEFLPLFDSDDFNVCGDEPWELGKGRSSGRAQRIGLGNLYLEFILKVRKLCLKHGKRMNMWADIVLDHPEIIPSIPRDIVMLNWDYIPTGRRIPRTGEITDAGLPLICCPGTNAWQSHGSRLHTAFQNVARFAQVAASQGAEGFMNTDWGDSGHRQFLGVSFCSLVHGAAHSWNTGQVDDADYLRRFTRAVFGDVSGALADSLSLLGDDRSGYWAYAALVESLEEPRSLATGFARSRAGIERADVSDRWLEDRIEKLGALKWPSPETASDGFIALALDEFTVATEMERIACERTLLARKVRHGKSVGSERLLRHAAALEECMPEFARLWRLRNRPSRLRDSLNGFRNAASEARRLAR